MGNVNAKTEYKEEGIPQDIALAVEALRDLRNSHGRGQRDTLLDKVRSNTLINNAVRVYEQSKNQYPKFRKGAEIVERKALIPMVKRLEETSNKWKNRSKRSHEEEEDEEEGSQSDEDYCEQDEYDEESDNFMDRATAVNDEVLLVDERLCRKRTSKRQKISNAIAKSKVNLKGYQLDMSIESKKRLVTCLHLLKLANYQLSNRVGFLQNLVFKEQQLRRGRLRGHDIDSDEEEEFYDASDSIDEQSNVVKMEIVRTVKKVYTLISKFTGNSLPEPARTQVRESLLKLPMNWTSTMNSENLARYTNSKGVSPNGKVLILAKESLGMVHNVMNVVDSTLGKAEEWVKQKQEIKELLKEQFLDSRLREKVKKQMSEEKEI
ncbi:transcriptional regulator OPI1 [Lachancea thermotolerans CBS 6340]|uniref:KLTH0D07546p n=1 Tax=Lachancea thermotolerans (strain ATCC 56472 / CBS 6340 / NRRL Y-8284) TaxID=559295 RepID=C5DGR8_LACTC|nr:KLTH0D07546p [Lachancea thermotolerans CBS 6340]CAR22610.1 KLTH0D07546p [Lachancea thermotolerans CBS 6340]